MAYQISEKNQILVALFAIVVLCAGKLFKDYLYRGGYVEGLTVVPVSNTVLRRPASGSTPATFFLYLTLGSQLTNGGTITVSWPASISGVNIGSTPGAAEIVPSVTGASFSAGVRGGTSDTFTLSGLLQPGSKIKITMATVTITSGTTPIDLVFTTTAGTEPAVTTTINIRGSNTEPSPLVSSTSSVEEIRSAIKSINTRLATNGNDAELLAARAALVNVLAYTYGTVKEAGKIFDSDTLVEAQKTAINFIAKEKARSAANAQTLTQDNVNKRRMAQVNTYYTRNYEANTEVMKNIIYVSISLIVLAVLRNKEFIPASISTLGVIFILTMGGIVIAKQVFDIMRRNDHDFDKYDWTFNEDDMNNKFIQQNADSNGMDLGMGAAPCYGPGCCDVGTTWDAAKGRCASSGGALSSQGSSAVWTKPSGPLTITTKISQALASGEKIQIILPSDVFTIGVSPSVAAASFTSVTPSNAQIASGTLIELTAPASDVVATNPIIITITDITVSSSADLGSYKDVSISTTKEPTKIPLRISGLV